MPNITRYLLHPQLPPSSLPPPSSAWSCPGLIGRIGVSRQEVLTTLSPTCSHHHPLPFFSITETRVPSSPNAVPRQAACPPLPPQLTERSPSLLWLCPLSPTSPEYFPSALRHVVASSRLKIINNKDNKTQP